MKHAKIGDAFTRAREEMNLGQLARAGLLVLRQGRLMEVAYGVYCSLSHGPSDVRPTKEGAAIAASVWDRVAARVFAPPAVSARVLLSEVSPEYPLHLVPEDFRARRQSLANGGDWCIVGEYARASARVCLVTKSGCSIVDYYNSVPGVCHIHSAHVYGKDAVLIATGDSDKLLDMWTVEGSRMYLTRRLMRRLSGFTASAVVNGQHYFGTDFDMRPNYILRLSDRRKFFYPREAFTCYAFSFDVVDDRYIVSLNATQAQGAKQSHRWAITIFDTRDELFVHSQSIVKVDPRLATSA